MVKAHAPGEPERHIDWSAVLGRVDALPATESEKAVLRIAAGLAGGGPGDISVELGAVSRRHRRAVRRALRRATAKTGHRIGDRHAWLVGPPPPVTYE